MALRKDIVSWKITQEVFETSREQGITRVMNPVFVQQMWTVNGMIAFAKRFHLLSGAVKMRSLADVSNEDDFLSNQ